MNSKPKKDLYATLDVKRDATPAEIKRAHRRRAEQVHPDKGGDPVEMAAVNHANDVLKDPARRLLYDKTGQDHILPTEVRARELVMQGFRRRCRRTLR